MEQLVHGGDWAGYRAQFGRDALDFSANVSPLGLPEGVAKAITAALPTADRYPDPLCRELRAKLALHEGVPADHILCGNGAADLIFRLVWAKKPRRALVTAPTFAEYAAALETVGCTVERFILQAADDFAVPEAFLSAIDDRVDLVFLCQPNNPTGQLTPPDSVARILEEMGLEVCGTHGTTAALAMLNDAVKKGGVMASSYVGGLSGAFIPVSEDQGMIDAVQAGAITLEKLEAMTCVCSVGLDMIAIPGDTKATTISGMIADEMALGMVNQKTTAARLIPVIGKGVGDTVEFGGLFGYAPIMPVNQFSCDAFINRGGRIPAPIHSFKN